MTKASCTFSNFSSNSARSVTRVLDDCGSRKAQTLEVRFEIHYLSTGIPVHTTAGHSQQVNFTHKFLLAILILYAGSCDFIKVTRRKVEYRDRKYLLFSIKFLVQIMTTDAGLSTRYVSDDKIVNTTGSTYSFHHSTSFTTEEMDAVREAKNILLTKHEMRPDQISIRELIIVTMNCKLRPDTAADKYKKWLELIDTGMGVKSFDMVWSEIGGCGAKSVLMARTLLVTGWYQY